MGIWACRKCDAKFTGKAYSVTRTIIPKEIKEMAEEPIVVQEEMEVQEESKEEE